MAEDLSGLINLLLGAAASVLPASEMVSKGVIAGPNGQQFPVFGAKDGSPLAKTATYRLWIAELAGGQLGLMKIAAGPEHNNTLEQEVHILQALQLIAGGLDREAERQGDRPYNHGAFFPRVVESMVSDDGRFLMFLGFRPSIASYKQLRPLPIALDGQRLDLQTVVWILGKALKVLDFSHRGNVAIGFVDASNLLLEIDQHGVFFFDWSSAKQNPIEDECLAEVAKAARIAWQVAGGTDTTEPPHDPEIMSEEQHAEFLAFLRRIMNGITSASVAHSQLYKMANEIWPKEVKAEEGVTIEKRPFHEWITYP